MTRKQFEGPSSQELYHSDHSGQSVLIDPASGKILLRKELEYYNLQVFSWLKEHPCDRIPNIVNYYEQNGHLIVDEEYIEGSTLSEITGGFTLDADEKKRIFSEVLEGIDYLHHAKPPIIHRDIKASNILITKDNQVKIIDYDAAKIYRPNEEKDTVLIGTEGSAAPEQYGFGASDQRTDIYALGILLKELFPHDRQMNRIAEKACRLDPDDRYQNIRELKDAFYGKHRLIPDPYRKYILPGFRTGTPWKMIVAVFCYYMIFYLAITFEVPDPVTGEAAFTGTKLLIYKIVCFCLLSSWAVLFTDYAGLARSLPLMNSANLFLRIIGYILNTLLIFVFWIFVLGMTAP